MRMMATAKMTQHVSTWLAKAVSGSELDANLSLTDVASSFEREGNQSAG